MTTAIALIRGVNVGGKHSLPMTTLRKLCEKLGWKGVATHIQSGNVVFQAPARAIGGGGSKAASALEDAIEMAQGFRPSVVVRTLDDLRDTIASNPFKKESLSSQSHMLVMFLAHEPSPPARKTLLALKPDPERFTLVGRDLFLWYPNGIGQSKFPFTTVEKAIATRGTCRNWNTVTKVLSMAETLEANA